MRYLEVNNSGKYNSSDSMCNFYAIEEIYKPKRITRGRRSYSMRLFYFDSKFNQNPPEDEEEDIYGIPIEVLEDDELW
jgi:hypothetical protein